MKNIFGPKKFKTAPKVSKVGQKLHTWINSIKLRCLIALLQLKHNNYKPYTAVRKENSGFQIFIIASHFQHH